MISDRQLALLAIGKSVTRLFNEGNLEDAWLWESWRYRLEAMSDKEFLKHYNIEQDKEII